MSRLPLFCTGDNAGRHIAHVHKVVATLYRHRELSRKEGQQHMGDLRRGYTDSPEDYTDLSVAVEDDPPVDRPS